MEPIERLWNNEIFLVRKYPCKKEKPLKLSHWHQPVLYELIQTSWVSSLLKGGGNRPEVTTVQPPRPYCEWGVVEEFLIEQCAVWTLHSFIQEVSCMSHNLLRALFQTLGLYWMPRQPRFPLSHSASEPPEVGPGSSWPQLILPFPHSQTM